MRHNSTAKTARIRVLGVAALLAGGSGLAAVAAGLALATPAPCTGGTTLTGGCTVGGTATLTGGTLTMDGPATLAWGATLNGLDQQLIDTGSSDTTLTTDDASGSNAGWHITAAATTFTSGSNTLATTGTLYLNGATDSESSGTSGTRPSAACAASSSCTLPTDTTPIVSYPVAFTTAGSASTIYAASTSTGEGKVVIGATHPVGWWVNVPANATAGAYLTTITLSIVSTP